MARVTVVAQCAKNPDTREFTVNQYTLLGELGRGTYCTVRRAQDSEGAGYAVKALSRATLASRQVSLFTREGAQAVPLQTRIDTELRILGEHPHPHIVGLVEVIDDPAHDTLYMILEGMHGGQLMEWVDDLGAYGARSEPSQVERLWGEQVRLGAPEAGVLVYQEAVASVLLGQLLAAVAFLHGRGVIHKDLKPDNVLLSMPVPTADPRFVRPMPPREAAGGAEGAKGDEAPAADGGLRERIRQGGLVAKVADFNTAVVCTLPDCHIWDAEGTQQFTPPECFDPQRDGGILGQQRDVWSVGCVLFAMLFGRCPFWHEEPIRLQLALISFAMDKEATVDVPGGVVSSQAEDLIRQLLCKDPTSRTLAAAALQHPWVQ